MSKFLSGNGLDRAWQKIKEQIVIAFGPLEETCVSHVMDSSIHVEIEDRTNWDSKIGTEFGIGAAELPYCANANTVMEAGLYRLDRNTVGAPTVRNTGYVLNNRPLTDSIMLQEAYYELAGYVAQRVRIDNEGIWFTSRVYRSEITATTIGTATGSGVSCAADGQHLIFAGYQGDYYLAAVYKRNGLVPDITEIAVQGFVLDSANTAGLIRVRHIATDQLIARFVKFQIGVAS